MTVSVSPVSFREDVNGLRAWAVASVLLFHFKILGFPGGFVGVDIFFVISGFLMTAIISKGLEKENFSIISFYMARARRILPALMALISVLLILGWFWLPTPDYKTLGTQSAFSAVFLSNVYYFKHSGYFDTDAHEKWLLHTWSLSVEWQFYIIFPILLVMLWRVRPRLSTFSWGLGGIFVISLVLNIYITNSNPNASFYLLPARGWELAAGGIVYLLSRAKIIKPKLKSLIFTVGIVLLISSITLISSDRSWPGFFAIFPVVGASLIILAEQSSSLLTVNPILRWFGTRSYSLYLWHWPFVVGLYFSGLNQDWLWVAFAVFMSLVLAQLSYIWIEVPTRRYFTSKSLYHEAVIIGLLSLALVSGAASARLFVFDGRLPTKVDHIANEAANVDPRRSECLLKATDKGSPACIYGEGDIGVLLVGDSHAASVVTVVSEAAKEIDKGVVLLARSNCRQLSGMKKIDLKTGEESNGCMNFNQSIKDKINTFNTQIPVVIVSRISVPIFGYNEQNRKLDKKGPTVFFTKKYRDADNQVFRQEFKNALVSWACEIAISRPVYLMRPIPEMIVDVPNTLSRNIIFGREDSDIKISLDDYHQRNGFIWQAQNEAVERCGVRILDPLPYLCDGRSCYGSKNGVPYYVDDDHLSENGNKLLLPMFKKLLFVDEKNLAKFNAR